MLEWTGHVIHVSMRDGGPNGLYYLHTPYGLTAITISVAPWVPVV